MTSESKQIYTHNWIGALQDSAMVSALVIPGTHQSLSMGEDYICGERLGTHKSTCQFLSISDQLKKGVRYFDFRLVFGKQGSLRAQHGVTDQEQLFVNVLEEIKEFLKDNEREFAIVRVKQESLNESSTRFLNNHCPDYLPIYSDQFEDLLLKELRQASEDIWWYNNWIPMVGEIRGKIVLIKQGSQDSLFKFQPKIDTYQDHEGQVEKIKRDSIRWQNSIKPSPVRLRTVQLNKQADLLGTPELYARQINNCIDNITRDGGGIITMDFPSEQQIGKLIGLNWEGENQLVVNSHGLDRLIDLAFYSQYLIVTLILMIILVGMITVCTWICCRYHECCCYRGVKKSAYKMNKQINKQNI